MPAPAKRDDKGLVYAYLLDGSGGAAEAGWEDASGPPGKGRTFWLHLDYENPHVREWLFNESAIPQIVCEALLEEDSRPRIAREGEGLLLVLRGVNLNPGAEPDDMVSLRIWVEADRVVTLRHRRVKAVEDIAERLVRGTGPKTSGDLLCLAAKRLTDRIAEVEASMDERLDALEEEILASEAVEDRSVLVALRRQVIGLRRHAAPQKEALDELREERFGWFTNRHRLLVRESFERTSRLLESMDALRERAAVVQDEINSVLTERMNRIVFLFSVVAAIFLPLTFVTGLLGINVGGIPFAEAKWGFALVSIVLVLIAVVEFFIFRSKRWL